MSEKVEIGKVCYKGSDGGHADFRGNSDYGSCGSHEYATIYVVVETDFPNPRGETMSAETVAEDIAWLASQAEAHGWCGYDG